MPDIVSKAEAAQWLQWVTPLPKRITIAAKQGVPLAEVRIRVPANAGAVERFAAEQLRRVLQQDQMTPSGNGGLDIVLGVCDAQGRLEGQTVPGVRP